jgi:hypothetical protein
MYENNKFKYLYWEDFEFETDNLEIKKQNKEIDIDSLTLKEIKKEK